MSIYDVTAALGELDALHRDALVVLALDEQSASSRTHWLERAGEAGLRDERSRKLTNDAWRELVERLVAAGAAMRDARSEHFVAPRWLCPVIDDAQRRGRLKAIANAMSLAARSSYSYGWARGIGAAGELLVALASNEREAIETAELRVRTYLSSYGRYRDSAGPHVLVRVLGLLPPRAWIERLSSESRTNYLRSALDFSFLELQPLGDGVREAAASSEDPETRARFAIFLALCGDATGARGTLQGCAPSQWVRGAEGFVALTEGKHAEAREHLRAAGVGSRKQRVDLPAPLAVFDVLCAVTSDLASDVADVPRRLLKGRRQLEPFFMATTALETLEAFRRSGSRATRRRLPAGTWIDDLVVALADGWMKAADHPAALVAREPRTRALGFTWLAGEMMRIGAGDMSSDLGALFGAKEGWELSLDSLRAVALREADGEGANPTRAKSKKKDPELWWTVTAHPESKWVDIEAYAAARLDAKGSKVSLKRIADGTTEGVVATEQDRKVAERLLRLRDRGDVLTPVSALLPMIGHPRVRDLVGRSLGVEAGEPTLRVETTSKGARIRLVPSQFDQSGCAVEVLDDRLVVYSRTPAIARIAEALPPHGLEVPQRGVARMSEILGSLGRVVAVDTAATLARESREADPRVHVQLFRGDGAMRVRLRVVPTAGAPPLRPGAPPAETVVHDSGGLVRVSRDLAGERARVDLLLERCPTLASLPREGDDGVARDLETSLELLLEIREAEADAVVEWLEGQPLRAPTVRSGSHVRVRVKGDGSWLSVEGEVTIDETRVVGMRELLENASRAHGRFVPIGDDEFLALTSDLRKKLEALDRMQRLGKDGRVSTALLPAVETMLDGLDVSFADAVAKKRDALERARATKPATPRALQAELRDYQRDGFVFLAQRTDAGLGACLADDMGLGKTVQALALLLHRSRKGPALVVAPTSVCRNWEAEAQRFAPSLAITRLRDGDRARTIEAAKPGEVVIASYGLLAAEGQLLASRRWATIVLDEAHALKNASTRRWAAAHALQADAIVGLTGTPVENHAGELHALFDLLIPGMLGTRGAFDRVLGSAIANGSREAAALLRQLVRPFVLRRTKTEVLSELPPRTEVLHVVPASREHLAFYEAVRRAAVEKVEAAKKAGGAKAGRARIDILAAITRLRRAAIDPRLVGGDDAPRGGKIDALAEIVSELRSEGRRALVFSQFLEVLDIARAKLEESGLTCLRLDGTMSEAARAEAASGFQSGRADVFLVSLKAGGVGMNLTAADVVILLDPWWNPAVEDQAAGRAHRLGQTRPVTVARLVTESTIEEKVLALHAKKRQLFDDVVADADGTGPLDVDAIQALLAGDPAGDSSEPS